MATPSHKARYKAQAPNTESATNTDASQTIVVHIKLSGTGANLAADWATIIATNFASSAIASWDRS